MTMLQSQGQVDIAPKDHNPNKSHTHPGHPGSQTNSCHIGHASTAGHSGRHGLAPLLARWTLLLGREEGLVANMAQVSPFLTIKGSTYRNLMLGKRT